MNVRSIVAAGALAMAAVTGGVAVAQTTPYPNPVYTPIPPYPNGNPYPNGANPYPTGNRYPNGTNPNGNYPGRYGRRGENGSMQNIAGVRRRLERMIDNLQRDQRDYGGHRSQAVQLLQQARAQLLQAEQYDSAHPGQ